MQMACSWGQIWTKERWNNFYYWYEKNKDKDFFDNKNIPNNIKKWGENSWLKYHTYYTILNNKYFVYPQYGLTTNFTDCGTHNKISSIAYQCNLYYKCCEDIKFRFQKFETSNNIYDAYYENMTLKKIMKFDKEIIADFYGEKTLEHIEKSKGTLLLSSQKYNYEIINSFSLKMFPYEMNLINEINGNDIFLYDKGKYNKNKQKCKAIKILKYTYRIDFLSKKYLIVFIKYFIHDLIQRIYKKIKRKKQMKEKL